MSETNISTEFTQLQENAFKLMFNNIPNVEYSCFATNLPGLAIRSTSTPTPLSPLEIPDNIVGFTPLRVSFLVDQNLKNYMEIWRWMVGIGFPNSHAQARVFEHHNDIYSEATLIITTNKMNPNITVNFHNIWPAEISDLRFTAQSKEMEYLTAEVVFRYTTYTIGDDC